MLLPDAVLFDMDGTLIDSEGLWLRTEESVMLDLGGTWTSADQAACLGGPLEHAVAYMIDKSGSAADPVEVGTLMIDRMEQLLLTTPLAWQPGARALLVDARSHGIPTALVSASWNRLITAVSIKMEADLGFLAFDAVVAGDDVAQSKPHPEPYLTAATALDANPSGCLALEDSPPGVASAVAAGCRVVAIPHLAEIRTPGAFVVRSLEGWTVPALWAELRGGVDAEA